MKCGRIECTGIHDTHRPWNTVCESTKDDQRIRQRQLRITPGTYRYLESHREGRPGLVAYIAERTYDLTRQQDSVRRQLQKVTQEIEKLKENYGKR